MRGLENRSQRQLDKIPPSEERTAYKSAAGETITSRGSRVNQAQRQSCSAGQLAGVTVVLVETNEEVVPDTQSK